MLQWGREDHREANYKYIMLQEVDKAIEQLIMSTLCYMEIENAMQKLITWVHYVAVR